FYNQDDELLQGQINEYKKRHGGVDAENMRVHLHPFAPRDAPTSLPMTDGIEVAWDGIRAIVTNESGEERYLASHLLGEHHLATMLAAFQVARMLFSVPSSGSRKDIGSYCSSTGGVHTPNPNKSSGNAPGMEVEEIERALQTLMPLPGRLNPLP